jgi:sRNA-binding regulator protein Hfq
MHEYPNPEIGPNMPDKKIPPVRIKIFLKNGMVLIGEIKKSAKGKIFLITDEGEFSIYDKDIKKKIILN